MSVNPLTHLELEAFCRVTGVDLSIWEARLIMRLDEAVLSAIAGETKPTTKPSNEPPVAGVDNPRGIAAILRDLAARKQRQLDEKAGKGKR